MHLGNWGSTKSCSQLDSERAVSAQMMGGGNMVYRVFVAQQDDDRITVFRMDPVDGRLAVELEYALAGVFFRFSRHARIIRLTKSRTRPT